MLEDLVIVYDIPCDKRRTKVHKILKNYGIPVQYSVFEARLSREDQVNLQIELEQVLEPGEDSLIFYRQCARCRKEAVRLGTADDPFRVGVQFL